MAIAALREKQLNKSAQAARRKPEWMCSKCGCSTFIYDVKGSASCRQCGKLCDAAKDFHIAERAKITEWTPAAKKRLSEMRAHFKLTAGGGQQASQEIDDFFVAQGSMPPRATRTAGVSGPGRVGQPGSSSITTGGEHSKPPPWAKPKSASPSMAARIAHAKVMVQQATEGGYSDDTVDQLRRELSCLERERDEARPAGAKLDAARAQLERCTRAHNNAKVTVAQVEEKLEKAKDLVATTAVSCQEAYDEVERQIQAMASTTSRAQSDPSRLTSRLVASLASLTDAVCRAIDSPAGVGAGGSSHDFTCCSDNGWCGTHRGRLPRRGKRPRRSGRAARAQQWRADRTRPSRWRDEPGRCGHERQRNHTDARRARWAPVRGGRRTSCSAAESAIDNRQRRNNSSEATKDYQRVPGACRGAGHPEAACSADGTTFAEGVRSAHRQRAGAHASRPPGAACDRGHGGGVPRVPCPPPEPASPRTQVALSTSRPWMTNWQEHCSRRVAVICCGQAVAPMHFFLSGDLTARSATPARARRIVFLGMMLTPRPDRMFPLRHHLLRPPPYSHHRTMASMKQALQALVCRQVMLRVYRGV